MESIFAYITESSTQLLMMLLAVFTVTYLLHRRKSASYSGRKLPPSLPVIGSPSLLQMAKVKDLFGFCISSRNKLGKIFSIRLGPK